VAYTGGGLLTGSVAGVTSMAGNATALTYYCVREYGVSGAVYKNMTVGVGGFWLVGGMLLAGLRRWEG
jgi:hypothetical protein